MKNRRLMLPVAALAMAVMMPAFGQDGEKPPETCKTDPRYAEFDFWVGSWDVYVDGKKAGENIITKEEGDCLVLERWTDAQGNTGQSYNFYNPDTEQWRQVWVSSSVIIDYVGGLTDDGAMELVGEVTYFSNKKALKFLGRWTSLDDGTVEQYFEQFDEEKGEMVAVFTGIYHRKP